MKVFETDLEQVYLLEPDVYEDDRGFFMESYHLKKSKELGIEVSFVQDNQSLSVTIGTLRGLHYQLSPYPQSKLIRVLSGEIWDVAVDIRPDSPTFKQWIGVHLSAANKRQLFIPAGYAHGFCTLKPNTEVLYKVDAYYSPECDRGIRWNDPDLNIDWPILHPHLSEKDHRLPFLNEAELPSA